MSRPGFRSPFILIAAMLCGLSVANAQDEGADSSFHWAYASYFGTGWYEINAERSGYILKFAPRKTVGEAGIDAEGNRVLDYTFRIPVTLGLSQLDFEDLPGSINPDNLATASVGLGFDVDIPVTQRFSLRPAVEVGYGTIIGESETAWSYLAGIKSRYSRNTGKLNWSLIVDTGIVGFDSNSGDRDDFSYAGATAEFAYPIAWRSSSNSQTLFHWNLRFVQFIDNIKFESRSGTFDSVANYWQAGFAFGKRDRPLKLWFMKFDRLGLAYNHSATGELRGIKFVVRSEYDL